MRIAPQLFAGFGIERDHVILRRRNVHHAVRNQRSRLERVRNTGLKFPAQRERFHILCINLLQLDKALISIVVAGNKPVFGILASAEQTSHIDRRCCLPPCHCPKKDRYSQRDNMADAYHDGCCSMRKERNIEFPTLLHESTKRSSSSKSRVL